MKKDAAADGTAERTHGGSPETRLESYIERDRDVKLTKLTEEDNTEAYLTTFERLMKAYEIQMELVLAV